MNSKTLLGFGALCGLVLSVNAFGQACTASNGALASPISPAQSFDLCAATDQLTKTCGNATTIGNAKDAIFAVSLSGTQTATITVTPQNTYQAYVALMGGASCNSNDTCGSTENESAAAGGAATIATSGLAAGPYFLLVSNLENTTCGTFTIGIDKALPVKLQSFSIN